MSTRKTRFIACGCGVLVAVALSFTLIGHAQAQGGPQSVVRTFAFLTSGTDLAPDYFLSNRSVAVTVVANTSNTQIIEFSEFEDVSGSLAGTKWVTNATHHATKGQEQGGGAYLWLLNEETPEPPPTGAATLTGPNSPMILSQEVFQVQLCAGSNCGPFEDGERYRLHSGGDTFVVVRAQFFR